MAVLEQAFLLSQTTLQNFANNPDFAAKMALAFNSTSQADTLQTAWLNGDFAGFPALEIRYQSELNGANGAYSADTGIIYLAYEYLLQLFPPSQGGLGGINALVGLILEEYGHYVDVVLNGSNDSDGDEGAIFSALVMGQSLSETDLGQLKTENDHGVISFNGVNIAVEMQNFAGSAGNDTITGTSGDDVIDGLGGNDSLNGLAGDDILNGGDGNDTLDGGDGNDILNPGLGVDTIDGNTGTDTLIADYTTATVSGIGTNNYGITNTSSKIYSSYSSTTLLNYSNIELFNITGTQYNDSFSANTGYKINAGGGSDTLTLSLSNTSTNWVLDWANANAQLSGDSNTQISNFEKISSVTTGSGNDTFKFTNYLLNSSIDGNTGTDTLIADCTTATVSGIGTNNYGITNTSSKIYSSYSSTTLLNYSNIELFNITGTQYNDSLTGYAGNDTLIGAAGDDTINGTIGDSLDGGEGTDTVNLDLSSAMTNLTFDLDLSVTTNLQGISGTEVKNFEKIGTITTGSGNDTFKFTNYLLGGTINGNTGTDTLIADYTTATGSGISTNNYGITNTSSRIYSSYNSGTFLNYSNIELFNITGTQYNDSLTGYAGNDTLIGAAGDDTINGTIGDSLDGGKGTDTVNLDLSSAITNLTFDLDLSVTTNLQGISGTEVKNFEKIGTITTGSGNDTFKFTNYLLGGTINGNTGTDTLIADYTTATGSGISTNNYGITNTSSRIYSSYNSGTFLNYSNIELFNITGTQYNDSLTGYAGNDTLIGAAGDDTINGTIGDSLDGGKGTDTVNLDLSSAITNLTFDLDLSVTTNLQGISGTEVKNFEKIGTITTGSGNDTFKFTNYLLGGTINGNTGTDTLIADYTTATGSGISTNNYGITNTSSKIYSSYSSTTLLNYSNIELFNITGTQYNDNLNGSGGNDTLIGGEGNDSLSGGDGNDKLSGVNAKKLTPGLNEIDTLSGGNSIDTFILGDAANIYYDDRNNTTTGTTDYARITDFNATQDIIQLNGAKSNYRLTTASFNNISGTAIYVDKPNTEPDELIGFIEGVTGLDINSNAFVTAKDEIAFSNAQFRVIEDGTPVVAVTVVRSGAVQTEVSATITLNNGTAISPEDYNNTPIIVNFAQGETSQTVIIPIIDDSEFELDETINLTLTNPTNGAVLGSQNTASLTIVDNEIPLPGILAFSATNYSITEDGTPIVTVTIIRTDGSDGAVSATLNLSDDTATAPNDYGNTPIVVNFAHRETSKTVTIPIVNDSIYEGDETLKLSLTNPTGGATLGGQNTANLTIVDNDLPTISLVVSPDSVTEDGLTNLVYTFIRTGNTVSPLTVNFNVGGTGIFNNDYIQSGAASFNGTSGSITFAAGSDTAILTLDPTVDSMFEADETVNLTLVSSANYNRGTTTAVNSIITNDDINSGTFSFSSPQFTVNEDGTPITAVTINRAGNSNGEVSVTINLNNGTATAPNDYNNSPIVVTFASGQQTKTVNIPIQNDLTREGDESINMVLSNPTGGANLGTQTSANLIIADNDIGLNAEYFNGYFNDNLGFFTANQPILKRTDKTVNFLNLAWGHETLKALPDDEKSKTW
ncbi:hemolysin-type calcium-binding region [Aphanothece sacrum FPU1]|uniref:Hemolysin-type calcium-binding region n=2 Tax=Aphanothece sacrum TaxID=1122 RepID=A0A401IC71_APHSA|nr:hemolysin-type calcium-binding region [Aphanothece sacrum FPU1]GBF83053.1 hemolysin-type calcium-binding protein [Aphanothece sacrum FPU3]